MSRLGQRLIEAMEEAVAIARGEADPSTYRVHYPADIKAKARRRSDRIRSKKSVKKAKAK